MRADLDRLNVHGGIFRIDERVRQIESDLRMRHKTLCMLDFDPEFMGYLNFAKRDMWTWQGYHGILKVENVGPFIVNGSHFMHENPARQADTYETWDAHGFLDGEQQRQVWPTETVLPLTPRRCGHLASFLEPRDSHAFLNRMYAPDFKKPVVQKAGHFFDLHHW